MPKTPPELKRIAGYVYRTSAGTYLSGETSVPEGEQWLLKSVAIRTSYDSSPQSVLVGLEFRVDKKGITDGGAGGIVGVSGVGEWDSRNGENWHKLLDILLEANDSIRITAEYMEAGTIIRWNITYEVHYK